MALNPHAVIRGGLPESSMTIRERLLMNLLVAAIIAKPNQPVFNQLQAAKEAVEAYLNEVAP